MSGSLIFALVVAVGLGFFLFTRWQRAFRAGRINENAWAGFAQQHGLAWQPGDLVVPSQIAGDWKGYAVQVEHKVETGVVSIEVETHTVLAKGLLLTKEEGAKALEKFAGFQDIQVGLPALDDLLLIQGLEDRHIQRLLRSEGVPGALGRLFSRYDRARVERDKLGIYERGMREPPTDLALRLDSLVEAAQALDAASRGLLDSDAVDASLTRRTPRAPEWPPDPPTETADEKVVEIPDEPSSEVLDLQTEGLSPPPAQIIREPVKTEDIVPVALTDEQMPLAELEATEERPKTLTDSAIQDLEWDEDPPGDVVVPQDNSTLEVAEVGEPQPDKPNPLSDLLDLLLDRSRTDKERQDALAAAGELEIEVQVSSVSRSSGRLPERLRRGRTVQANLPGDGLKRVTLRFPADRNLDLDQCRFGQTLNGQGTPVGFDDFTRQLTIDMQ